jgi:hypothetical protein
MSETACTCFSEVPDCPLMWAHYANSHRGVCFIFQELAGTISWFAFDVTYSEKRPHIDYTGDAADLIKQGMLNKSSDWAYEQEHRMFEYRRGAGYRTFPPTALLAVIYGARISDDDRAYVDQLVALRGSIQRYQASIDDQMFRLNIEQI